MESSYDQQLGIAPADNSYNTDPSKRGLFATQIPIGLLQL